MTIFRQEDVTELVDPDHTAVKKAILAMPDKGKAIIAEGKKNGREEVIAVAAYYAGHGNQDGYNYALMNQMSEKEEKRQAEVAQGSNKEESKQRGGVPANQQIDESDPRHKVRVFSIEKNLREILGSKEGFFVFYIHHACREPYNVEKFESAF